VFGSDKFQDRPDAENLVVFVTDGVSTDGNVTVNVQAVAADLHELTETVSCCERLAMIGRISIVKHPEIFLNTMALYDGYLCLVASNKQQITW